MARWVGKMMKNRCAGGGRQKKRATAGRSSRARPSAKNTGDAGRTRGAGSGAVGSSAGSSSRRYCYYVISAWSREDIYIGNLLSARKPDHYHSGRRAPNGSSRTSSALSASDRTSNARGRSATTASAGGASRKCVGRTRRRIEPRVRFAGGPCFWASSRDDLARRPSVADAIPHEPERRGFGARFLAFVTAEPTSEPTENA